MLKGHVAWKAEGCEELEVFEWLKGFEVLRRCHNTSEVKCFFFDIGVRALDVSERLKHEGAGHVGAPGTSERRTRQGADASECQTCQSTRCVKAPDASEHRTR